MKTTKKLRVLAAAAGVAVAGVVAVALPSTGAAEPGAPAAAPAPAWGPCLDANLPGVPPEDRPKFSCAWYTVPLDHANPTGPSINLALMKRAADDPTRRIGSLFLNPGGPGGSGFRTPTRAKNWFEPEVLAKFDMVGFDPRGVAASTPLRCFATAEDAHVHSARTNVIPTTDEAEADITDAYQDYGKSCGQFSGGLIEHMSTADVARDLDLLRQAVGDKQLSFVGFSYGTLLGATYANMFPDKARALILDGNVDPKLRLSDGLDYDRQRTRGFEIALDAFLKRCKDVGPDCAFSDGDPRAKFDQIRDTLRQHPVVMPDGTAVDLYSFTDTVSGNLYSPEKLADTARLLAALHKVINPQAQARAGAERVDVKALLTAPKIARHDVEPDTPYATDDSYFAVNCTDKPFTHKITENPKIADTWEKESPTFGRYLSWSDPAGCTEWPVKNPQPYTGPWNNKTANPLLVIGNYYDPATQYEYARRMTEQLHSAELVSVDAFGHCILGDSSCVDKIAARYLVDGQMPPPGVVCHPDTQPFPGPPPAPAPKR
ncbi:pimeloyl-ACP methyl ester carboxylesterase [Herbihabitans rhizosphaerae]|uniref:Pimeloyl-ACP methyl ester carboxylesterase n=1 Tax=Herbihabitans rhizosphaerae TaxID=1872711 RepID=A0A4Q7L161_9PSEU|nr:alpha/beta hydrolase [Herbihabitans rhizosphaerae]RZS43229.1 pimeloyl-ACP methyl ester carboxylesterase [Herbihabitans rhizosphaerae]